MVCPVSSFDITTAAPFAAQINIAPTPTTKGKDTQVGLYIEDEWKPDEHWTINAGLRWDFESNANNKDYVTPPAIAAALRSYQGWAARGINPEDYISNGHNRKPFWGEFQPRFGVAYDVHGDHDLIIFGGAGRYYDRSLFIEGQIEQFQNSNVQPTVFLPACAGASPPAYCHDPDALRTFVQSLGTGGCRMGSAEQVEDPLFGSVRPRCAQAVRRHPGVADVQPRRIAQHLHVCAREFLLEWLVHAVPDQGWRRKRYRLHRRRRCLGQ